MSELQLVVKVTIVELNAPFKRTLETHTFHLNPFTPPPLADIATNGPVQFDRIVQRTARDCLRDAAAACPARKTRRGIPNRVERRPGEQILHHRIWVCGSFVEPDARRGRGKRRDPGGAHYSGTRFVCAASVSCFLLGDYLPRTVCCVRARSECAMFWRACVTSVCGPKLPPQEWCLLFPVYVGAFRSVL